MNILIVGCGKVGSRLASVLSKEGHDVSVVDKDERSFSQLDDDFSGITVTGIPIDQDVLRSAGIENCDALAAMTPDDNVNIMVSQVGKEIFGVTKVVTRIYDPAREDVFSHFGLSTICPTNMTVDTVRNYLLEDGNARTIHIGFHTFGFFDYPLPSEYKESNIGDIREEIPGRIFAVLRDGEVHHDINDDFELLEGDNLVLSRQID